jgi:hypothetical protein
MTSDLGISTNDLGCVTSSESPGYKVNAGRTLMHSGRMADPEFTKVKVVAVPNIVDPTIVSIPAKYASEVAENTYNRANNTCINILIGN